ncbi:MAG: hypothetical protein GX221_05650 [Candidatus Riflebacteria bacterium]|nr:hypothetical protein [Candidatus Riflebacteria bacterium]
MTNNIVMMWDFDSTLTSEDSSSITINIISKLTQKNFPGFARHFWESVEKFCAIQDPEKKWESVKSMHAPVWMFNLARLANEAGIVLDKKFFKEQVVEEVRKVLRPNVSEFLRKIKDLQNDPLFSRNKIQIHHFIVSAGLKDLIQEVFEPDLISAVYGCRFSLADYKDIEDGVSQSIQNVPVYCMDETSKTRAVFEISKGSFLTEKPDVNQRTTEKWADFPNVMYIGDGFTDVPALSVVRERGGIGIIIYDEDRKREELNDIKAISRDKRADFITPADFSLEGELFKYMKARCTQIRQRIEAENF